MRTLIVFRSPDMRIPQFHRPLLLLLGLAVLCGVGRGQGPTAVYAQTDNPVGQLQKQFEADSTLPSSSAELVSVDLRLAETPVPAGRSVRAAAVLTVEDGWHINAHRPTYDYLIGTTLDWTSGSTLTAKNVQYPPSKRLDLDFADDAIDVYEGTVPIFFDVRPTGSAEPGEQRFTARLRVQACNDRTCLQPSTVRAGLSVPVGASGTTPRPTADPLFEAQPTAASESAIRSMLRQHGLFLAGGALALGTVLFLVVYSWVAPQTEEA